MIANDFHAFVLCLLVLWTFKIETNLSDWLSRWLCRWLFFQGRMVFVIVIFREYSEVQGFVQIEGNDKCLSSPNPIPKEIPNKTECHPNFKVSYVVFSILC